MKPTLTKIVTLETIVERSEERIVGATDLRMPKIAGPEKIEKKFAGEKPLYSST